MNLTPGEKVPPLPARFADLKATIAASYPDFEKNATQAWAEMLAELDLKTKEISAEGVNVSRYIFLDWLNEILTRLRALASIFHKSSLQISIT